MKIAKYYQRGFLLNPFRYGGAANVDDSFFQNVVLLMHFDDASAPMGKTFSGVGATLPTISTAQSKFGGASGLFNGSNFIQTPSNYTLQLNNSDWTIEGWIYPTAGSLYRALISKRADTGAAEWELLLRTGSSVLEFYNGTEYFGTTAIANNIWTHVAATMSGTTLRLFVNGVLDYTTTGVTTGTGNASVTFASSSAAVASGNPATGGFEFFTGYLDEFRVTKGVARYTSTFSVPTSAYANDVNDVNGDPNFNSVSLLMHFDGTNGSTTFADNSLNYSIPAFTDSSSYQKYFTIGAGSPYLSSSSALIGSNSAIFLNSGIQTQLDSSVNLTGGDWTIEATVLLNSGSSGSRNIIGKLSSTNSDWQMGIESAGKLSMYLGDGGSQNRTGVTTIPTDVRVHLAASMQGTTLRLFVDGSLDATHTAVALTDSGLTNTGQAKVSVGWLTGALTQYFPGKIDELRVTKGVARYTAAFTPSNVPFASPTYSIDPWFTSVVLSLHGNGTNGATSFIDSSVYGKTPTIFGNVNTSTAVSKFGSASILFDGAGDQLLYAHNDDLHLSSDFTIEAWIYPVSATNSHLINKGGGPNIAWASYEITYLGGVLRFSASSTNTGYDIGSESGATSALGTPTVGAWNHIAISRNGSTFRGFLNGVLGFTITSSAIPYNSSTRGLQIGAYFQDVFGSGTPQGSFNGYVDDIRITNGIGRYPTSSFTPPPVAYADVFAPTDPLFNEVVLLMKFNGTNNSSTFTDNSLQPKTFTSGGTPVISSAQSKFGCSSAFFNGSSFINTPDSDVYDLSTKNFCIEGFLYQTSRPNTSVVVSQHATSSNGTQSFVVLMPTDGKISCAIYSAGIDIAISVSAPTALALNQWNHFAFVRNGNTIFLYINGSQVATTNATGFVVQNSNRPVTFGNTQASNGLPEATLYYTGYIDEFRFTVGSPRYTANFTTPSLPFPVAVGTTADPYYNSVISLLHFDGANGSTTFTDEKGKVWTGFGDARISTTQSTFGGASVFFDGNGDYLSTPSNTDFNLGADFTIEFLIYPTSLTSNFGIIQRGTYTTVGQTWNGLSFGARHLSNGLVRFYFFGTTQANEQYIDVPSAIAANTWRHIAITRAGTVGRVFVNGVLSGSISSLNTPADSTQPVQIGRFQYDAVSEYMIGYIDEMRLTKGVARYTTNFTPSATAFPNK